MKHPYDVYPNDEFISVVIPTYCRPFYLEKALDTLAEFADMPYEVIVHDDGSRQDFKEEVFAMSHRISTTIFNNGMNMGLCVSPNRCISVASSKYILFLNDDCFFVDKCLSDICNTLSKEYVGLLSVANDIGDLPDKDVHDVGGTRFAISNYLGGGSTIAFRKSVWEEVGGFDTRSTSGQADNVFIYKMLRAGYWKAVLEGHDRAKVGNFEYGDEYSPTQPFTRGNDCSVPKIFGMPLQEMIRLNVEQRVANQYWVDGERTIPDRHTYDDRPNPIAGLNDIPYWGDYFVDVFGGKNSFSAHEIDWEVAKIHGHDKWKKEICKDFGVV